MKKLFIFLFLSILLLNFIYAALDCDYTDSNPYYEKRIVFYENSSKLDYDVLEVKDIIQGVTPHPLGGGGVNMQFKVYNNYNSEINVTIKYIFDGALSLFETVIAFEGYSNVIGPQSPGLNYTSIDFVINSPMGLEARKEMVRFNNETCKICPPPDGFICLNNGDACNISSQCGSGNCIRGYCSKSEVCYNKDCKCNLTTELQCQDNTGCVTIKSLGVGLKPHCRIEECITGDINIITGLCASKMGDQCSKHWDCISGVCNIAGFCDTKEIVPCEPYGKLNCNNLSCLIPYVKQTNEAYMCDWECVNGTRACNGVCKAVSSKKVGQEYNCEWECKSNRFRDGKCLSPKWVVIVFFSLIFLIFGFGMWFLIKSIKDLKGKIIDKLNNEIISKKKDIDSLENKKEEIEDDVKTVKENYDKKVEEFKEREKNLKEKHNLKILDLEEKLKNKEGVAKKEVEEEIKKEKEKRKEELENLDKVKKENRIEYEKEKDRKKRELNELKCEIDSERETLEAELKKSKILRETPRLNQQGYRVTSDEEGYEIYNGEKFNRFWYRKNYNLSINEIEGFHIHHIDGNRRNNEIWNLIKLSQGEHSTIHRFNKNWLDYNKGIEILQKYNIELPSKVKEHLKEIK